jgi:V-type H+-transporting ATPase subunit D
VVIPKIEETIKWIESELDELDREDFYRLKCVQDKKQEAKEIEAAEVAAR